MTDQPERCEAWDFALDSGWLNFHTEQDEEGLFFFQGKPHEAPGATIEFCPWCGAALPDERHQ